VIDVDARPSRGVMVISGPTDYEEVRLEDFRTHHRVSEEDFAWLGRACVVGCWPWASLCLLLHLARLPWDASRGLLPFLGTVLGLQLGQSAH